jgi:hypothetical protein
LEEPDIIKIPVIRLTTGEVWFNKLTTGGFEKPTTSSLANPPLLKKLRRGKKEL